MNIEAISLDEVSMERLHKLPSPRATKSRIGAKSSHMDQMTLLEKMNKKRLKDNPTDDQDYYTHGCAHCKNFLTFPWKANGRLHSRTTTGSGSHHTVHVQRHLSK